MGITLGPVIEEVLSVVYVCAASVKALIRWRIAISVIVTSLLFVWCHTHTLSIPWMVIFCMGIVYALIRWRYNSTGTAALMHATYNGLIVIAMMHWSGL